MITAFFVVDFGLSTEVDRIFRPTEDDNSINLLK